MYHKKETNYLLTTTKTGFCPNCNHKVLLRRGCCVHCGTPCQVSIPNQQKIEHNISQVHPIHPVQLAQPSTHSEEKSSFCSLCGTKLDIRYMRFCPNCGAEL